MKARRFSIVLGYAAAGWLYCGMLMAIGLRFVSLEAALVLHAVGAPLGLAGISWLYYRRFGFTSAIETAVIFLGVVLALDVFVVALMIEQSFAMFRSFVATWLPLSLSFASTYAVGLLFEKRQGRRKSALAG